MKIKLILGSLLLLTGMALGQGQFSGGGSGGTALPTPGGAGLCLVSTGNTPGAYTFGSCTGSASTLFSSLTTGTNTQAAMTVGTGASLAVSGTGTITASALSGGGTVPSGATLTIASGGTFTCAAGSTCPTTSFPLLAPNGSNGAPSYSFTNGSVIGMYLGNSNNSLFINLGNSDGIGGGSTFLSAVGGGATDAGLQLQGAQKFFIFTSGGASLINASSGGVLIGAKLTTTASSNSNAGFNLPPGSAPTSPVNGDCWITSAGLFCQIAGATVGPYGSGGGSGSGTVASSTIGYVPCYTGATTVGTCSPLLDNGVTTANILTYAGSGGLAANSYGSISTTAPFQALSPVPSGACLGVTSKSQWTVSNDGNWYGSNNGGTCYKAQLDSTTAGTAGALMQYDSNLNAAPVTSAAPVLSLYLGNPTVANGLITFYSASGNHTTTFQASGSYTTNNVISVPGFIVNSTLAVTTGTLTAGDCLDIASNNTLVDAGFACNSPTLAIPLSVTGMTSGGILYGSSSTAVASSAALGSGQFVLGGGPGSPPTTSFSVVPGANGGFGTSVTAFNGVLQFSSGTPSASTALTNGTTATTQTLGDATTKVATDAFVAANAVTDPCSILGSIIYQGVSALACLTGPTTPNVQQFLYETPSGGAATAPAFGPAGIPVNAQSGSSYTIAATDRANIVEPTNNTSSTSISLPQAGTTGFASNFVVGVMGSGSVPVTVTPTTSTVNGNANLVMLGQVSGHSPSGALLYSNNTNYLAFQFLPVDGNGRLGCEGFMALTGDATNTAGSCATTVGALNGGSVPASAKLLGTNSSSQPIAAALPATDVYVGNVSNLPVAVAVSGDSSITTAGVMTNTGINSATLPASSFYVGTNSSKQIIAAQPCVSNPQTTTYQVLQSDFTASKCIAVSSGTFTITLVASGAQPANGQWVDIYNYGGGVVTVARSGQNINGTTSNITLAAASASAPTYGRFRSDGSNYDTPYLLTSATSGGSVTSIATTSPITGGTITTSGTIACATCVTSAASLTSTAFMTGAGSQASQTPSATATLSSGGAPSFPGLGTFSSAGAASTPGLTVTGAPYTAGSATTNFPQTYLNAGAAVTSFSTAGTMFGGNAPSGFTGNLIDEHVNGGASVLVVTAAGQETLGSSAPTVAGSPSGGGFGCTEGTGPTAAASAEFVWCNSTSHDLTLNANGGVTKLVGSSIGYNSGSISASVGSTNVATSANFPTGQYLLNCDVVVTAVGATPTLAVTIGWTDISGTARTKTCTTGVVTVTDNPVTQTITSNGSAAITVTQTLAVSTATWQTTVALTRLQ